MTSRGRARATIFLSAALAAALVVSGEGCSSNDQTSAADGGGADAKGDRTSPADASQVDSYVDAAQPGPSTQLAANGYFTCAIVAGVTKCWGSGALGQLGPGFIDSNPHPTPVTIPGIAFTPTMISATYDGACVTNGTLTSCWGDAQPLPSSGLGSIQSIATGDVFSCVLSNGGSVSCVGYDGIGELGPLGDGGTSFVPVPLVGVTNVAQLEIGVVHGCALESDGSVWCWGENGVGELGQMTGDGGSSDPAGTDYDPHATPLHVPGITANQISASLRHVCATLTDGTVSCWGANGRDDPGSLAGQLGHDPATDPVCISGFICDPSPSAVAGLSNVREVSAGSNSTCAVKTDNTVVCWGNNSYGELGFAPAITDGGDTYNFNPQVVPGLTNVAHVVVGYYHACAVTWDDHVMCWGDNEFGQLGVASIDGGATFSPMPVAPEGL